MISSTRGVPSLSVTKKNKAQNRSNGENHLMVVLDHKIVKRKDISNNENLSEVLVDERLDTLPEHYQERSPILIEPTQSINIGTTEIAKTLHLAASLIDQEKPSFIRFFEEKQINFALSYADMPGIDPNLIMHIYP